MFVLYSVAYKGKNTSEPNNATLMGIFEPIDEDIELAEKTTFLPLNSFITPAIVPRFRTLQDLADRIGLAISDFTGINTAITVRYNEATETEPGSFLFGIQFEKKFESRLSFSTSVELGDIANISVVESLLSVSGGFKLSNEFGVSHQNDQTMLGCTIFHNSLFLFSPTVDNLCTR